MRDFNKLGKACNAMELELGKVHDKRAKLNSAIVNRMDQTDTEIYLMQQQYEALYKYERALAVRIDLTKTILEGVKRC